MDDLTLRLKGLTILVVDGDPDSLALLSYFFADYNIKTLTAESVDTALALLRQQPVNLIITEIALPAQDGYSLLNQLSEMTPAIALTSYVPGCNPTQAKAAGFRAFLSKPVDLDALISTVGRLTGCGSVEMAE